MLIHIPFTEMLTHSSSSSSLREVLCFKPSLKVLFIIQGGKKVLFIYFGFPLRKS